MKWRLLEPVKAQMLNIWQGNAHKKGIASPGGVVVCLNKNDINDLSYAFSHIQWKGNQVAEYVIHPSTVNDSPYFGKIVDQRITEWRQFTADETHEILKNNDISLADFFSI